jgi:hypothetical protein
VVDGFTAPLGRRSQLFPSHYLAPHARSVS